MASTARRACVELGAAAATGGWRPARKAVGVVGHDDLGRGAEELAAQLVEPVGQLGLLLGAQVARGRRLVAGLPSAGPGGRTGGRRGRDGLGRVGAVSGGPHAVLAFGCPEAAHAW